MDEAEQLANQLENAEICLALSGCGVQKLQFEHYPFC